MYRICKYCGRLASMCYRYLCSYVHICLYVYMHICFLSTHLDYFADNFVDYSEEQGGSFNQDMLTIDDIYQENVTINILDDNCWSQKDI